MSLQKIILHIYILNLSFIEKNKVYFKEEFENWLPNNGVKKAQKNYSGRIKSIEAKLGNTIENIDRFIEEQVLQITPDNFPDVTERVLDDYKVALRSYWKFIKDKKKIVDTGI